MAGASPNPIAGAGTIRFALGASGPARLALYDAAGRRVRTLVEGPLAAGQHTIGWDGRDDRGAQVASGVYFARLNAGRTELCSKVVLMRP
jgi:flagellar hook assembly protein FlgD